MILIVLCGLPGSGKTTFVKEFMKSLPPAMRKKWVSYNQDALGSRKAVIKKTEESLLCRQNVIVDRSNFDFAQRAHWINLGNQSNVDAIVCIVMPRATDMKFCARRAFDRGCDGLHSGKEPWDKICKTMFSDWRHPTHEEGFRAIYQCSATDDKDIPKILDSMAHHTCEPEWDEYFDAHCPLTPLPSFSQPPVLRPLPPPPSQPPMHAHRPPPPTQPPAHSQHAGQQNYYHNIGTTIPQWRSPESGGFIPMTEQQGQSNGIYNEGQNMDITNNSHSHTPSFTGQNTVSNNSHTHAPPFTSFIPSSDCGICGGMRQAVRNHHHLKDPKTTNHLDRNGSSSYGSSSSSGYGRSGYGSSEWSHYQAQHVTAWPPARVSACKFFNPHTNSGCRFGDRCQFAHQIR